MTVTTWGVTTGWIDVALGSLVLVAPISPGFVEPQIRAIAALARELPDGPLPAALSERIHRPLLGMALYTLVPLLFGIVFLMAVKPSLSMSLVVMGAHSYWVWWPAYHSGEASGGDEGATPRARRRHDRGVNHY
jgi:hypothetical protein